LGTVALVGEGWDAAVPAVAEAACPRGAARLLDAGAADAVCRDDPDALVAARLAALARRTGAGWAVCGDLRLDPATGAATRNGRVLRLRAREAALLAYLARAGGRCVSRGELLERVWGLRFDPGTNLVAVHVSRLRAELDRGEAPMLHTVRGGGYRLAPADAGD
jgi:two-component system OmpR family response regulator